MAVREYYVLRSCRDNRLYGAFHLDSERMGLVGKKARTRFNEYVGAAKYVCNDLHIVTVKVRYKPTKVRRALELAIDALTASALNGNTKAKETLIEIKEIIG